MKSTKIILSICLLLVATVTSAMAEMKTTIIQALPEGARLTTKWWDAKDGNPPMATVEVTGVTPISLVAYSGETGVYPSFSTGKVTIKMNQDDNCLFFNFRFKSFAGEAVEVVKDSVSGSKTTKNLTIEANQDVMVLIASSDKGRFGDLLQCGVGQYGECRFQACKTQK